MSSPFPWWHTNRLLLLILAALMVVAGIVYGVRYITSRDDRTATAPPAVSSEPYEPKFTKKKHPDKEKKKDKKSDDNQANR